LRDVRLYRGFREFAGTPVSDPDALERMRAKLGEDGEVRAGAGVNAGPRAHARRTMILLRSRGRTYWEGGGGSPPTPCNQAETVTMYVPGRR
jgi:hypothetical protein